MGKLPNLYALRFFLALSVVVFHIPSTSYQLGLPYFNGLPILNRGLVAVNFFFTLSGFLIIRNLYLKYEKDGKINIAGFYLRRILRLWPVYYLVLAVGLLLYLLVIPALGIAYETDYSALELTAHYVFFAPNVFAMEHKVGGILNVLWSVGVEEQFYMGFPLLLLVFGKRTKLLLMGLLLLFLGLLFFHPEFYKYRNFYFYFAAGGLLALLGEGGKLSFLRFRLINATVLLLFVLTFFTDWLLPRTDFAQYHLFNLVVSGMLITTVAYYPLFDLDRSPLRYLGEISYGIYMYHMLVVTLFLYAVKFLKLDMVIPHTLLIILSNLTIIAITLLISHLSYQYFERRFYKKS